MKPLRFGTHESDLRTKLLLAILRASDWQDATSKLLGRAAGDPPVRSIEEVVNGDDEDWPGALKRMASEHGGIWCEFAASLRLKSTPQDAGLSTLSRIEDECAGLLGETSYFWTILRCYQCFASRVAGDTRSSEYFLREAKDSLESHEGSMIRELCAPIVEVMDGGLARFRGDFGVAMASFRRAVKVSTDHQLTIEPIARFELASLLWASGQFTQALELHRDKATRSRMAKVLAPSWLIQSHLSAAKCAIDLRDTTIAAQELQSAQTLLTETTNYPRMLPGYALLYSGELEILRGAINPGLELLEKACQHFESMTPPFHTGLLDAKVSIAEHAISTKDHPRLIAVLHKLLEEADEKQCFEARARVIVLESALFVSDNPPLREAFDDLVTRSHLIHNPALMLQALANIYLYSIRFLDEQEQAFHMARLRRLQRVLDADHFQDLYEKHIEKRYGWAIESRLAEFLEGDETLLSEEAEEKQEQEEEEQT